MLREGGRRECKTRARNEEEDVCAREGGEEMSKGMMRRMIIQKQEDKDDGLRSAVVEECARERRGA